MHARLVLGTRGLTACLAIFVAMCAISSSGHAQTGSNWCINQSTAWWEQPSRPTTGSNWCINPSTAWDDGLSRPPTASNRYIRAPLYEEPSRPLSAPGSYSQPTTGYGGLAIPPAVSSGYSGYTTGYEGLPPSIYGVHVSPYVRRDGTYVDSHYRSVPDGIFENNWSSKGNINPHTGKPGTRTNK
jgi:hypothetical protein